MADAVNPLSAVLKAADKEYHFKKEVVPKRKVTFGGTLRSLAAADKYVWYTPALMYLWGRFSDTPLIDITRRTNCPILWYRFDEPIFRGLELGPDNSWNYMLWACPREHWDGLVDGVLETAQFDLPKRLLYTYALQVTKVYDPLVVDRQKFFIPGVTATLDINVFAVCTNKHQIVFRSESKPGVSPAPIRVAPERSLRRLAAQFFSDPDLTSDNAFGRYKDFLLRQNDAEFELLKAQFMAKIRKARS